MSCKVLVAAEKNDIEVLRVLCGFNADISKADNDGTTPAFVAAENGHVEVRSASGPDWHVALLTAF